MTTRRSFIHALGSRVSHARSVAGTEAAPMRARENGGLHRLLFWAEAALITLYAFASAAVPRTLPILLGALGLVGIIHVLIVDPRRVVRFLRMPVSIALGAFILYLFINSSWAAEKQAGFVKALIVLSMAAALIATSASLSLREIGDARSLAKWALAGLLVGIGYMLIELAFDEPIMRFLDNHLIHLFRASPKKVKIVNGEVVGLAAFVLNRNAASLVLLFVPALLFVAAFASRAARFALVAGLVAGTAGCVLFSQSGTSGMAFFVGLGVLGLAALSLKATRWLLIAVWTIGLVFAVPLGAMPYALGWQNWTWLPPESVAARFYIWRYTADKTLEHPIVGIGIRSTRDVHADVPLEAGTHRQTAYALRPGRHAHNIFLETWFELGAIGAALFLLMGLAGLWQMKRLPPLIEGTAYALFATCCAVGISGFDLWQTWLLASFALPWAMLQLARAVAGDGLRAGTPREPQFTPTGEALSVRH